MSEKPRLTGRQRALRIWAGFAILLVGVLYIVLVWDAVFQNDGKPLTTLQPAGPNAQSIQDLVVPVFSIAGIVGVLVLAAVLYITWKYRERSDDDAKEFPGQLHGKTALEIGWTVLPAVLLIGIGVVTVMTIIQLEKRDDNALQVKVEGQQWWWKYDYDLDDNGSFSDATDLVTANEMVIPVNRQVDLTITSNDVIHSFWIPGLNGKKDAVPGMDTHWLLEGSEIGVFRGQCTEFCGLSHANMRMVVRVVSQEDYEAWVANQLKPARAPADGTLAAEGNAAFEALCAQCHVIRGEHEKAVAEKPPLVAGVAPDLTHLMTRGTFAGSLFNLYKPIEPSSITSENRSDGVTGNPGDALLGGSSAPNEINRPILEEWLRNPPAMKPAYAEGERGMPNLALSEEQIDQLVAYLETLK